VRRSSATESILRLYSSAAARSIYDEAVTELQHAGQAALLADAAGASPPLIAAALLHDVGHLVVGDLAPVDRALAADSHHEQVGAWYLRRWFGPDVTEPVAQHVAAKRYLWRTEPDYAAALSPSSVRSLEAQGGPMSAPEVDRFRASPMWEDSVALRRWDDSAKQPHMTIPEFSEWLPLIDHLTRQHSHG